jgi:pre-rRNA-processing protein TSR3
MNGKIKLIIYHINEDDPKKCSAKKMKKFGLATLEEKINKIPKKCILLNPFAEKSLSLNDRGNAIRNGIIAVDCSWKNAENSFNKIKKENISRALPFLIAVNPVNYGKILKLTTLEALSAALYILGYIDQAADILKIYKWGPNFLKMNKEPLEDYRKAKNSKELIEIMKLYLDK